MSTVTEREISDQIFLVVTSPDMAREREQVTEGKKQRDWLLAHVRSAVLQDGKDLLSDSGDTSLSRHGSLFHRLTLGVINDVEIYVILNGHGLLWEGFPFAGSLGPNRNNSAFPSDFRSIDMAGWMCRIVCRALSQWDAEYRVSQSARGAKITALGSPGRDYDVIPAFMLKDGSGQLWHILPNGGRWELTPTKLDMQMVIDVDRQFCRRQEEKILGYCDLVRAVKSLSEKRGWFDNHDAASVVIRFAVAEGLHCARAGSEPAFNQVCIDGAIAVLSGWIRAGHFKDPYSEELIEFSRRAPVSWDVHDLAKVIAQ